MPILTVHIAQGGSTVLAEPNNGAQGTSTFGHMWYSVSSDGTAANTQSFGFAPDPADNGTPFAPGYVYTNDNNNYVSSANGTVSTYSVNISQADYNTLLAFGQAGVAANGSQTTFGAGGTSFNNHYNGLDNSCIDFTWAALSAIGIQEPTHIPGTLVLPSFNQSAVQNALQQYQTSGKNADPEQNKYDAAGNLISSTQYDANGNVVQSETATPTGSSSDTLTTTNSSGTVIGSTTESIAAGTGAYNIDAKSMNGGTVLGDATIVGAANNANTATLSGNTGAISLDNTTVNFAANTTTSLSGLDDQVKLSTGDSLTLTDALTSLTSGVGSFTDTVSATGTGNQLNATGLGGFNVNTTGITSSFNSLTNDTLSGNGAATVNNIVRDPNFIGPVIDGEVTIADGAHVSLGGTGSVDANYGDLNVLNNSDLQLWGNNETTVGNSTDTLMFGGVDDIFQGTGAALTAYGNTDLTVLGQDTLNLDGSNLAINASNSSVIDNSNSLTDLNLLGTGLTLSGTGTSDSYDIFGTNDIDYNNYSSSLVFGSSSGDIDYGSGSSLSSWTTPDYDYYDPIMSLDDPIVLNLAGAKVSTQNLTSSSAYFDIQNNGTKDHTGWGTAGEGYLVYDPASTNTVTNEASLVSSFAALKNLDANHDGVLNALDPAWASMKVWVDSAGNASFTAGSLKTMSQLGITSINLNSTHVNQNQNNNTILDDSTFTWNSGATGDIAGVDFNFHASTVVNAPPPPAPAPPTCVHVDSVLPDGTTAGEVKVGQLLELADAQTLEQSTGEVTHSETYKARGVRITTHAGISLVCSDTAPIATSEGLLLAPQLLGKRVATRRGQASDGLVEWQTVTRLEHLDEIEVQLISVGDRCFWAGEQAHAYILHHNKVPRDIP